MKSLARATVFALTAIAPISANAEIWVCPHSINSNDKKPVMFTNIKFWWGSDDRLKQAVSHVMLDHTERDRWAQYHNTSMSFKGQYDVGFIVDWYGVLNSNPRVSIQGHFEIVSPGVATYTESWYDRGKYTNHVTVICHEQKTEPIPAEPFNDHGIKERG